MANKNKSKLFNDDLSNGWINNIDLMNQKYDSENDSWSVYASGYKEAANLICEQIINKRILKKYAMIYPIIYLYRHYLELQFKNIILKTKEACDMLSIIEEDIKVSNYSKDHNLSKLYEKSINGLKLLSNRIEEGAYISEDFLELSDVVKDFEKYDKLSQSFRYPVDRKGKAQLGDIEAINIKNVYDLVNKSTETLDGAEWWLNSKIDLMNEHLSNLK